MTHQSAQTWHNKKTNSFVIFAVVTLFILVFSFSQTATASLLERWSNQFFDYEEVEQLNIITPVGDPFTRQLAIEYRRLANLGQSRQASQRVYRGNARLFAAKGLEAAKGNIVPPERPENWHIDEQYLAQIELARSQLLYLLDIGLRRLSPVESAVAQARFDCWLAQAERRFQWQEGEPSCRDEFLAAVKKLQNQFARKQQEQIAEPATTTVQSPALATDAYGKNLTPARTNNTARTEQQIPVSYYTVFFPVGGTKLREQDDILLLQAAEIIRSGQGRQVIVKGYADPTGNAQANLRLSQKRAETVRDMLVRKGVPDNIVSVEAHGAPRQDRKLTRAEKDRMRRVEIIIR